MVLFECTISRVSIEIGVAHMVRGGWGYYAIPLLVITCHRLCFGVASYRERAYMT